MNSDLQDAKTSPPAGPLREAHAAAKAGRFTEALALAERARAQNPSNIQILAYLKELEGLRPGSGQASRPPAEVEDILRSLDAIARNAGSGTRYGDTDPAERREAFERLKERYFLEADLFRARGELERALEEVRRVFILDPKDVRARAYETALRARIAGTETAPPARRPDRPPLESFLVKESPFPPADFRPVERGRSGGEEDDRDVPQADERPRRRRRLLPVSLVLVAAAAGLLTVFLPREEPDREIQPAETLRQTVPETSLPSPPAEDTPEIRQPLAPGGSGGQAPAGGTGARTQGAAPTGTAERPTWRLQPPGDAPGRPARANEVPRLLVLSPPSLAPALRKAEGTVKVRVQVAPDGRPLQARIVESSNPAFNSAVIEAMLNSQFEPARTAAGPVTAWVTVPLSFRR